MARPRKEINKRQFESLCKILCTLTEIASVFGVSIDTVERWCEREYQKGFAETYKQFSADGKISLRRAQMRSALKGNAALLIWLGKQHLGQREQVDVNVLDRAESAIQTYMREVGCDRESAVRALASRIPAIDALSSNLIQ